MSNDNHYIVCNKPYTNKLQAYREALPQGHWPHWYFYEKEFLSHNWTEEPTESLELLYKQRAQGIRDRYDYVICWLSGGSDSDNLIRSFLKNNLHIDEIWHRNSSKWHNRVDCGTDAENHCSDLKLAFIPQREEYKKQYPNFKSYVHTFDVMDVSLPFWEAGSRNPYEINSYNPIVAAKEYKTICGKHPKNAKVCHVYGIDKPQIQYKNKEWYLVFFDGPVLCHDVPPADADYDQEFFYWHPAAIKLLAKQAHIIKNFFVNNPSLLWMVTSTTKEATRCYNELIKTLIYPDWNINQWQPEKQPNDLFTAEFFWFYNNPEHLAVKNWVATLKDYTNEIHSIYSTLDSSQHNFTTIRTDFTTLPGNYSKMYRLG